MPEPIQIFKPGRHTAMSGATLDFAEADIIACAAAYNPELHEAPIVVGHPRHDDPAYGWIKSLSFTDGALSAEPHQINEDFADLVTTGAFKKVSASFYPPHSKNNPSPGSYYLRHVGFLGAQPPAVKGLAPVAFGESEDVIEISFGEVNGHSVAGLFRSLRDYLIGKFGQEEADKALPGWDVDRLADQAAQPDPDAQPVSPAFAETPP